MRLPILPALYRRPQFGWQSRSFNRADGFTLIEVLLTVTIIGILSTVVLIAIDPAERVQAAYDSQRRADLAQMRDALETYAAAHDAHYPSTGGVFQCDDCGVNDSPNTTHGPNDWIPDLVAGGYIKQLPHDPQNGSQEAGNCTAGSSYGYVYVSDGKDYKLMAYCTVKTDVNGDAVQQVNSSSYCPTAPPYDATNFVRSPSGVSALKAMVDPRRPRTAYAAYTEGYTCK
jgi:prepilin-type N-terminal cleavage/methylation domain-containing protein